MGKWTKKAELERMRNNQDLQQAYRKYPLARLLVESAAKTRRYEGYHRISHYYAYKDWMWSVTGVDNRDGWTCVGVIDDLLPPDTCDLGIEGPCISTYDPPLPGLPERPPQVEYVSANPEVNKHKYKLLSEEDLDLPENTLREKQRSAQMRATLEEIARGEQI